MNEKNGKNIASNEQESNSDSIVKDIDFKPDNIVIKTEPTTSKPKRATSKPKEAVFEPQSYHSVWTETETEALLKGVQNHKWGEWNEISRYVGTRNDSQVEARCRYLSKNFKTVKSKILTELKLLIQSVTHRKLHPLYS